MEFLTIALQVLVVAFSVIMGIFILLHRASGGGVSDMFGGGMTSSLNSTGVAEKNLTRFTITAACIWVTAIIARPSSPGSPASNHQPPGTTSTKEGRLLLDSIKGAFRSPDLRAKLLITLGILTVFRLGSFIPAPGVIASNVQQCLAGGGASGGIYDMVNMFSGGALLSVSIVALGVMPYITASIMMQLLKVIVPRLKELHSSGQQAKVTQYTRYLAVGMSALNATTVVTMVKTGALLPGCALPLVTNTHFTTLLVMVISLIAGSMLVMWMGEKITERGVGNGMSLLIFTSIASGFPTSLGTIGRTQGWGVFTAVLAVGLVTIALVVFVEQSPRRIPVVYAKRVVGRQTLGGSTTFLPIKVNMAGVATGTATSTGSPKRTTPPAPTWTPSASRAIPPKPRPGTRSRNCGHASRPKRTTWTTRRSGIASSRSPAKQATTEAASPIPTPTPTPTVAADATPIATALKAKVASITKVTTVTEALDSNQLLGRPNQYTSAAWIADSGATPGETGIDGGAVVEVFANAEDAKTRSEYILRVLKEGGPILGTEWPHLKGAALLRVSGQLSPSVNKQYAAAFGS